MAKETGESKSQSKDDPTQKYTAAANKYFQEAKIQMDMSGNIKTTIKESVTKCLRGLHDTVQRLNEKLQEQQTTLIQPNQIDLTDLNKEFEKQHRMTEETNKKLEEIQMQIAEINETQRDIHRLTKENKTFTYADALTGKKPPISQRTTTTINKTTQVRTYWTRLERQQKLKRGKSMWIESERRRTKR